jgi:hypothetical protein
VFYNWKGQLRTRAKKLKQIQDGKTGVDDKLALQKLTDVEKRALKLWKEDFQDKDIASVRIDSILLKFVSFPLHGAQKKRVCTYIYREGEKNLFICFFFVTTKSRERTKLFTRHAMFI